MVGAVRSRFGARTPSLSNGSRGVDGTALAAHLVVTAGVGASSPETEDFVSRADVLSWCGASDVTVSTEAIHASGKF